MGRLLPCSKTDQPNLLLEIVPWQLQAFKLKQPRESLATELFFQTTLVQSSSSTHRVADSYL